MDTPNTIIVSKVCFARLIIIMLAAGLIPRFSSAQTPAERNDVVDTLYFGNAHAEHVHSLQGNQSDVIAAGGLGQPARRLLPLDPPLWEGGRVAFIMKIDPTLQNYFTVKLWGSDISTNRLVLFIDGKQVGYHHIGDVDLLDFGNGEGEAPFNGRFFYNTLPLPIAVTRGRSELACEIRSIGQIWGYGTTFEQYQKIMKEPTRGIYAAYTHTDGCFTPPTNELQGTMPANPPIRHVPGNEVFDAVKTRVNDEIKSEIKSAKPLNEMQMQFLARAYGVHGTEAYQNPEVVKQVTRGMDQLYTDWRQDPKLGESDPSTPNPGWFTFGPAGEAVTLLAKPLADMLDLPAAGTQTVRRTAWSQLLQAGRDYHTHHRRMYSNQSMITDLNICWSNRGVASIDPGHALPERQILEYLYQSVGLKPWLGSETASGPEKPMGDRYFVLTEKGLTKELGYVGYYGEVLDWVTSIYDSTRPAPDVPGDKKIRQQIINLAKARSVFRYPALDADGNRAMRIESMVGWRDDHRPGNVCYAERTTWDASSLYIAEATLDPTLVGYVQQMFQDGQYFSTVAEQLKTKNLRGTAGMLLDIDQFEKLKSQAPSNARLPMSVGQPDFAWADEQDGVMAIKHGDEILYASLYWRARQAVNFLARVHDIRPESERVAVIHEEIQYADSGKTYIRPDYIDQPYGRGGMHYPGGLHSAEAGEILPIAKLPPGDKSNPGDEDPAAGRGSFYTLRYGGYLIGMNATADQSFILAVPRSSSSSVRDLVTGRMIDLSKPVLVGPYSTIVLDLPSAVNN